MSMNDDEKRTVKTLGYVDVVQWGDYDYGIRFVADEDECEPGIPRVNICVDRPGGSNSISILKTAFDEMVDAFEVLHQKKRDSKRFDDMTIGELKKQGYVFIVQQGKE